MLPRHLLSLLHVRCAKPVACSSPVRGVSLSWPTRPFEQSHGLWTPHFLVAFASLFRNEPPSMIRPRHQ